MWGQIILKSAQQLLKFEHQHHSHLIQIFIKVLAQGLSLSAWMFFLDILVFLEKTVRYNLLFYAIWRK